MKNLPVNIRAAIFVMCAYICYNIADAFVKKLMDHYTIFEAALYPVMLYAVFVIVGSQKFGGLSSIVKTKKPFYHTIRSFFGTGCFLCMMYAIKNITFAEAYTLLLTSPFWIAITSIFFFKEQIGWHRWLAIAIGFFGVLVVLRPGIIEISPASLAALAAAGFYMVFVIFTKKIGEEEPLINMVLYPIITDIIILAPIVYLLHEPTTVQSGHIIFFAFSGLFYLIGTTLVSKGFASGDSSMLAPFQYIQIIGGLIVGYFFFNEVPEIWTIVGAGIIVLSGIYLLYREYLAHKIN